MITEKADDAFNHACDFDMIAVFLQTQSEEQRVLHDWVLGSTSGKLRETLGKGQRKAATYVCPTLLPNDSLSDTKGARRC